jgi:hypothetical protein
MTTRIIGNDTITLREQRYLMLPQIDTGAIAMG